MMRHFMVIAMTAVAAGCGSGFIEGWREEKEPSDTPPELNLDDATDEEACGRVKDASWLDAKCVANAEATEAQCSLIADWAWFDAKCRTATEVECLSSGRAFANDRCFDKPAITTDGELSQTIVAGFAIEPITLTVSPGSTAKLADESCAGFFKVNAGKLESTDGTNLGADVESCSVKVSASSQFAASEPVTVKVGFKDGYFRMCQRDVQDETMRRITNAIIDADDDIDSADCTALTKTLVGVPKISLESTGIKDLTALSGLRNLKILLLGTNPAIEDLSALSELASLTYLDISYDSRITDLRPIAGLAKLTKFSAIETGVDATDATKCPRDAASPAVARFCTPDQEP